MYFIDNCLPFLSIVTFLYGFLVTHLCNHILSHNVLCVIESLLESSQTLKWSVVHCILSDLVPISIKWAHSDHWFDYERQTVNSHGKSHLTLSFFFDRLYTTRKHLMWENQKVRVNWENRAGAGRMDMWQTLVLASRGAPLSSSISTDASWPLRAAQWRGVRPSCSHIHNSYFISLMVVLEKIIHSNSSKFWLSTGAHPRNITRPRMFSPESTGITTSCL